MGHIARRVPRPWHRTRSFSSRALEPTIGFTTGWAASGCSMSTALRGRLRLARCEEARRRVPYRRRDARSAVSAVRHGSRLHVIQEMKEEKETKVKPLCWSTFVSFVSLWLSSIHKAETLADWLTTPASAAPDARRCWSGTCAQPKESVVEVEVARDLPRRSACGLSGNRWSRRGEPLLLPRSESAPRPPPPARRQDESKRKSAPTVNRMPRRRVRPVSDAPIYTSVSLRYVCHAMISICRGAAPG